MVESTGAQTLRTPQKVALLAEGDDEAEQRRTFRAAIGEAFSAQGIETDDAAGLIVDFAISTGAAEFGVQRVPAADAAATEDIAWIDAPRRPRRFDECEAQELRGTLILVNRSSGETVYRGRAMATECEFDEAMIRSLADALVQDFLAQS